MSVDAGLKQLKVISRGVDGGWSEFQSLGVKGIKELAKAPVRFLTNLTAKWCSAFENRVFLVKRALGGIIDFS